MLRIALLSIVVLLLGLPEAMADAERGLILESHIGQRPRDADYLLAPLVDELKRSGFKGSSVAGTRIHSQHSIASSELSNKEIEIARRAIVDGHAAYLDFRFEGAVDAAGRGLEILMRRPATMARQQRVREYAYEALITISMANKRLGKSEALQESMSEFIRSFPDRDVSHKKYGPEGAELFRKINKRMSTQKKGQLQVAAGEGAMIFVNERYIGLGSQEVSLFPGRYRIYTQSGPQAGRVHIIDVAPERKQTLVVDSVVDRALRTDKSMVGFVFDTEAERSEHERRVTMRLGKALGAQDIILVGLHKYKGKESIVASSISITTGDAGPSAMVPLPAKGAPSAEQLRALAAFVAGAGPATADIEVLNNKSAVASAAGASGAIDIRTSKTKEKGISSAWRWTSWGLGAVGIGAGAYLMAIDGTGSCSLAPGQQACPENYDTQVAGIGTIAGGTALGLLGFYFWTQEGDDASRSLTVLPRADGGIQAALSGTF